MRPIGSKSKQYKKKNSLTYSSIKSLISDYSLMSNSDLQIKYNISETQLRNIRLLYKLKLKRISELAILRKTIDQLNGVCGIYLILRSDGNKGYIGSSYDIGWRIKNHISSLGCNTHYNKSLQDDWGKYTFSFYLVKECPEEDLLKIENELINKYDSFVLYNKNVTYIHDIDYKKLYNRIISKIEVKNECWEWMGSFTKDGYGKIQFNGKTFLTHRTVFIYTNKSAPMLVHHTCKNRKCCNPKHLQSVSYKVNSKSDDNIMAALKKSSLFNRLDEVKEMLKRKTPYKDIWRALNVSIGYPAVFSFCKKVELL